MKTYKQMKQLVARTSAWIAAGLKLDEENVREYRRAFGRLRNRAARPRWALPNGRGLLDASGDSPARHVHPRHLRGDRGQA